MMTSAHIFFVMAALVAAIQPAHVRALEDSLFRWMAGSSPAMTMRGNAP
jgi:hypothetical protein